MRLIDADKLENNIFDADKGWDYIPAVRWKDIENAPAVDAEPVIRCKDCDYACASQYAGCVACCALGVTMGEEDFCSQGEKKEE